MATKNKSKKKIYWGRKRWKTYWSSKWARKRNKKLAISPFADLEKKKSRVLNNKKTKMFRPNIRSNELIKAGGGSQLQGSVFFALRCQKACKLNYTTMIGIKKKMNILGPNFKIRFRRYPNLLLTRKSKGARMGKGRGKFSARVAVYKKGEVLLETSYLDRGIFDNFYKAFIKTLPVKTRVVPLSVDFLKESRSAFNENVRTFKRTSKKGRKYAKKKERG